MTPLQAVVAICLVLAIGARSETLENTKESTKDVISESEQSEPQARAERCTTCSGGVKLSFKSPNDVLAAIQALPGGEVHTQQSFEGCSSDKGCAGLKVKDGRVVEKFGNVDAFQAAAAADTGNEFQFHAGGGLGNVFEGGIPDGGPFWWMNQNSPFKNGAAGGNFEKFSKSSSSFTSSGTAGAGGVDIAANPFLNGDFSKLAGGFGAGAESKPGFSSSSFESSSFSSSSKGDVDISKNPFLNGGVKFGQNGFAAQGGFGAGSAQFGAGASGAGQSGAGQSASQFGASQSAFSASNNAFGAQGSQGAGAGNSGLTSGSAQGGAFGGGFSGSAFNAASNKFGASGYTGSSPSPFTASTGSNVNLIQSSQKGTEFDFEQQQQTQQNIDEAFQSTGNVHAHEHSGGDLQQTCAGQGYVCVHKAQCNNGVVNTNGAGVVQARTQKQYCNTRTEICCRIEVSSVGAGSVQGSLGVGSATFQGSNGQGSGLFVSGQSSQAGQSFGAGQSAFGQGQGSGQSGFNSQGSGQSAFNSQGSSQSAFSGRGSGQSGFNSQGSGQSGFNSQGSGQSAFNSQGSAFSGQGSAFSGQGNGQSAFSGQGNGQNTFNSQGRSESAFSQSSGQSAFNSQGSGQNAFNQGSGPSAFNNQGRGESSFSSQGRGESSFTSQRGENFGSQTGQNAFGVQGGSALGNRGSGSAFERGQSSFESSQSSFGSQGQGAFGNGQGFGSRETQTSSFGANNFGSSTFGAGDRSAFGQGTQTRQGAGFQGSSSFGAGQGVLATGSFGSNSGSSSFGAQGQSAFGATNNRGTSKFGVSGSVGTGLAPPANKINNVYKSTSQSNFVETDSFSAGSEVAGVFRPGAGPGLKPGIPYLPPVDTVTQPSFISSTSVPFTTTPKPFVPVRPPVTPPRPYLPPVTVTTSTSAPGYLPPDVVPGESKDPPPYYVTGSLLKEPFLTTPSPAIPDTPSGCAAALKCTPIEFCTAEGVISTTAVVLTRDQEAYRVPLTDCKDVGTGTIGKCCRDPLYTDPWPTNQLGKWVPGVFGGNDGKYVPDSNPQSNNPRGQVTGRPPVTGSVIRNEYKPSTPGPYGPNQVTPGFPSSTVSSFKGQGSVTSFGQGQYSQGGVGQYNKGGQGQYTVGGQGQYTVGGQGQVSQGGKTQFVQREQTQFGQGGQGQVGIGGQGQVGIGGQGQFGIGQQGQIGIQQGGGQTQTAQGTQFSTNTQSFGQKGQGQVVRQGQGSYVEQGQGSFGVGGRGQYTVGGQGQLEIGGGGAQGQFTQVQGETQKTFGQGSGFGIGIGQGQTGFGISTGFGQGVIQGQGQGVRQGFGSAIQQGFGQAIVQGEGETSASEGVYRVFLGRYSGGNGQCGLLNGQKPYGNRNDLEVDFAEIPWQAMVLLQTNRSLLCGGVITRPDVVVTSASCVDGLDAKNVLIKGGEWKLGVDDEPLPFQIVQVKTIVKHPYYKIGSLKNDAAILVLSENLRLAKNIQPICLPESGETLDAFYNGAGECIVTGWGKQVLQAHLAGSIMHSLNVSLLNPGECQAKLSSDYPHLLEQYDQDSCACGQPLNPVNNICKVDIGSALACTTDNSHYVLRGLYSWDSGCQTGNQIAAFYKFDLEWYEWAIGLIESTRFAKFAIGSKVTQNRFSSQIKGSSSQFGGSSQYNSGVKGVTSSGIKGGVKGAGFQEQTGGLIAGAFQGSSATASATTGSSGAGFGSGISGSGFGNGAGFGSGAGFEGSAIKGGFGTGQFGFSQFGSSSKFTEGSANGGLLQSEIKGPISNSFSATYSEKKVFQTEPKIITYTTKPEIVTFTTKPEIVTFTTKPEYFTFTTKPKIVTYTTKPQIITYETSGSGTNPQYVAPGVTFNPSFGEAAGLHKHNAQCKCLEKGKK